MSLRPLAAIALLLLAPQLAHAGDFAFAGRWKITGAVHAPWEDPDDPMITDDEQRYNGKVVTIAEGSIKGPEMLGCGKTEFSIENLPFASLFEGGLATDPKDHGGKEDLKRATTLALQLGFTTEPVPTLSQGCSELSLHLRDANTLMFGLDNRIFTLKKL